MRAIYERKVTAICPIDGKADTYDVTVTSDRAIIVEILNREINELACKRMFQEDLTVHLARELLSEVKTVGWHSGVKVTVTA